jgi:hypothetical protein
MKNLSIFLIIFTILISIKGHAQEEFGFTVGLHQTSAQARAPGNSISSATSFRAGVLASFLLEDALKFRTGLLFTQRNFAFKENGTTHNYNLDYIDVPALIQYNFRPNLGLYGGFMIAMNTGSQISPGLPNNDLEELSPVAEVGLNILFDNVWGFDIYAEQGFESIDSNTAKFSSYGINLVYFFL